MQHEKFSTLNQEMSKRWRTAAEAEGIQEEAFTPEVRIVPGNRGYNFGVIRNEHRFKRAGVETKNAFDYCNLCNAVRLAQEDAKRNLAPDYNLADFIVTVNKFPINEGFSMAISEHERPMFTTQNLHGVAEELATMLDFADKTGFEVFHNSPGFGATIPTHEHWHLTTFRRCYDIVKGKYGFDAAEKSKLNGATGVSVMPEFPFAHLIFDRNSPDRLVNFLARLHKGISHKYEEGAVPHTISQGCDGLLVTVGKSYLPRCRGSGDVAGHMVVKSEEEFSGMDYKSCFAELDKLLFRKEDLDLRRFI